MLEEIKCLRCNIFFNEPIKIKRHTVARESIICPYCGTLLFKALYIFSEDGAKEYINNLALYDEYWHIVYEKSYLKKIDKSISKTDDV